MASYTSGVEVYELLVNLQVGDPARITIEDAEQIVEELEAQVNAILRAQAYSTIPATNTEAKQLIGGQVRKKAAVQVHLALEQPQRTPDWCRTWDIDFGEWLTALRKGQMLLPSDTPGVAQEGEIATFDYRVLPIIPEEG